MLKFFKLLCCTVILFVCNVNNSTTLSKLNHDFLGMSCNDLMYGLIKESSFNKTFMDKSMKLEFYFERHNDKYIMLKFVRTAGAGKGVIYGNFQLDLVNRTLNLIDPDPQIPVKINKDYAPFIAEKCTPDQNLYGNTGRLPDK